MRLLEREDIAGAVERIGQRIDVIGVVVQVEAGGKLGAKNWAGVETLARF